MRTTLFRVLPAAGVTALAVALSAGAAGAQQDPPGNNGTVKIDDVPFDDHPDNEPHDGCVFQVDFYGFDAGDLSATVTFEAVPPTAGGVLLEDEVDIGEDAAGGGTDLDASATYDLSDELAGIEPHPQQGHHIKLTVHAEGSQGADTKHKVFWVEGCGPVPTTSSTHPTTPSTGPTTPTTPGGNGTTPPSQPGPDVTTPAGERGELPVTGSNTLPLTLAAVGLIGLGVAGVAGARHLRATKA